ncbi:MAG: hypothetical protein ABIB71_06015 [Candidatus Woesearchaeota archaeon]
MDIVPETINRIRLSDSDLKLLYNMLQKIDSKRLSPEEEKFYKILVARVEGRLKLKEQGLG